MYAENCKEKITLFLFFYCHGFLFLPTLALMEFLKDFFAFDKDERPLIKEAIISLQTYLIFAGYLAILSLYAIFTSAELTPESIYAWTGIAFLFSLLTNVDVKHYILPDHITLPLIIVLYLLFPLTSEITPTQSFWGLTIGGGGFALLAYVFFKVSGKHGMGGGDIKLMAALGIWVGGMGIPILMLFASLSSLVTLFIRKLFSGGKLKDPLPFGPFLCAGAVLAVLFSDAYWQLTQNFLGH